MQWGQELLPKACDDVIKDGIHQNHEKLFAEITFVPSDIFASLKGPKGPQ